MDIQALINSATPLADPSEDTKRTGVLKRVAAHTGRKNTPETIHLMSIAKLGKPKSEEHRRNLSQALLGKPRPDLAEKMRGRKLDPVAGAKMGATNSAKARAKLEAFFAPHREVLEAATAQPVMQKSGTRINWDATSLKYGLPVALIAKFMNARKAGKV